MADIISKGHFVAPQINTARSRTIRITRHVYVIDKVTHLVYAGVKWVDIQNNVGVGIASQQSNVGGSSVL
jgi:hypothetical protein